MTDIAFSFLGSMANRGEIAGGESANEFFHPLLPADLVPSNGFLLVTNGWNLNRRLAEVTGYDDTATTAVQLLQMRAPDVPITPALSMLGTGRVFRRGAKWRYRWYSSLTGEFSGLSPIPSFLFDVGAEAPLGSASYIGQNAYFRIATSGMPPNADTLQLFANTSWQDDLWFLADQGTTVGVSYVNLVDDNTDDDLFTQEFVSLDLPSGPSWPEGLMPPVVHATRHPTGSMWYSGVRRMGTHRGLQYLEATPGSDLLTVRNDSTGEQRLIEPGRVGQRVRLITSSIGAVDDPTTYRIVQVTNGYTIRVYPEIQVSVSIPDAATTQITSWAIEDDRDARAIYRSETRRPWLIDLTKTLYLGEDFEDTVLQIFFFRGITYAQTRIRIYGFLNDVTDDLSVVPQCFVASEYGSVGFHSGCITPYGWVFVHEGRGVLLFDGSTCMPLGRTPDPYQEFSPATQFSNFDKAQIEETRVAYDWDNHTVVVSYIPSGMSTLRESLFYVNAARAWRGPHRLRVYSHGSLRSTRSDDTFVYGDDFGNLAQFSKQAKDLIYDPDSTQNLTGAVASSATRRSFTSTVAAFNPNSDERVRGAPVWFTDPNGVLYSAHVSGVVSTSTLELDSIPVDEDGNLAVLASNWTYAIGSIRWSLTTSYLDMNEPILEKTLKKIGFRFKLGSTSETFYVAVSTNGSTTFSGERISSTSAPESSKDVSGLVSFESRLFHKGVSFQIRVRGLSRAGEPQITGPVVWVEVHPGTQ